MQAVILAAGESSRFWPLNQKHKSLTRIMGKPLIAYLIEDLRKAGIKDIIIVQSPKKNIEKELKDRFIKYVVEKEALGTGDSLLSAEKLIKNDQFFLFNADDSDAKEAIIPILSRFKKGKSKLILLASITKTPWLFGILKTKGNKVLKIIEKPKPNKEPSNLKNDNLFLLPKDFFNYLKKVPSHPFSLINALNLYAEQKLIEIVISKRESFSLKFPWHIFPILERKFKDLNNFKDKSIILGKNVIITGDVFIGQGTKIGANTVIYGPCYIGKNCQIGDNNVFRGPVNLEDNVKTGAFFEIKNSVVGSGTHFHSGYLGNSLIGDNCRIGAGFNSANRRIDRKNIFSIVKKEKINTNLTYFGTIIGNNTSFGVRVTTMPGVFIGSNCLVGPGSVVFENIPDNIVFYQKFKGIVKKRR
ncbi:MAG: hypothetical protein COU70_01825 [Parcubacteria group bacterium CG10_big_fil_rev_8_21_14_0_10_35_15]|nr:MAG: hypothetical protein COU70_01825 [Parcubacteria group bacterium CG10_big_fil_rev_8_21_14_0_10_35_15]